MEIKKWECSYCKGNEYLLARQSSVFTKFYKQSPVEHEVCTKCGTISRSYAINFMNLKK